MKNTEHSLYISASLIQVINFGSKMKIKNARLKLKAIYGTKREKKTQQKQLTYHDSSAVAPK